MIRRLYRLGYDKKDVILLFEFIDWAMSLPEDLERGLWTEILQIEEGMKMEYITSVERIGMEKGMVMLLGRQIAKRFQTASDAIQPIFAGLAIEQIEEIAERFVDARSLDEIRM